ncbi:uncharacterized protein LOC143637340 [Bidens hawaiensis]|uniref:uncharacterized protein LOC143637340 n=1 Tax=Bidens hawaiensis TaxID=980011 RepID=UPI00404A8ED2
MGLGHIFEQDVLVKKLLDAVPDKYFNMVASIEQMVDLDSMRFEDAIGRLKAFEERLRGRERAASESQSKCGSSSLERGRGRDTGGQGSYLTEERVRERKDLSQIKCFRCDEIGHFASSCPERRQENQEANLTKTNEPADRDLVGYLNLHEAVYLNEERVNPKRLEAEKVEKDTWYLDNGASNHMTGNQSYFSELNKNITGKVKFGDGSCVDICGKGKILLKLKTGGDRVLSDVYFIPSLKDNIISLGQATENGCNVHMKEDYLLLYNDEGKLMMKAFRI